MRTKTSHIGARLIAALQVLAFVTGGLPAGAQLPPPPISRPEPPGIPKPGIPPPGIPDPAGGARGVPEDSESRGGGGAVKMQSLNFKDSPLDQVLDYYGEMTGRTMIKSPGVNATITLKSQSKLTHEEIFIALNSALAMNNITLVPMGTKFFKVVNTTAARTENMPIDLQTPENGFQATDKLVSQIVTLNYIEIADAQTAIQGLLHTYAKVQPFERINSLMITESESNLARIMEVLDLIDQPAEMKVVMKIYELKYADAAKIASKLGELISESQGQEEKPRVAVPQTPSVPSAPPGVIRPMPPGGLRAPTAVAEAEAAMAEKGIIQGKVKIIADDRTNILIVFSRPSNFITFNQIVGILDVPVEPEITVRVVTMEYADATDVAGILNDFVGVAKAETAATAARAGEQSAAGEQTAGAKAIEEYVRQRAAAEDRVRQAVGAEQVAKIGQLSPNTKILPDKRTNSILLMGTRGDIAALEKIIDQLDIMLAQVLIEAVILEVNLNKNVSYGVDWLQRSMIAYNQEKKGPGGGVTVNKPVAAYGGAWSSAARKFYDGATVGRQGVDGAGFSGGLNYFLTLYDLNLDAVIKMASGSADARVLSTPVILTTDNTEAMINSSEQRPVVTQTSTTEGGQIRSSYEYRDIGIKLKVKPRINPARYVVMEITQTADTPGEDVKIDDNLVPRIFKREMQASIAVESRTTIVLGGVVQTDHKQSRNKVPILGDIPLLGIFFRSDTRSQTRTELLVLITPYVLMTPDEARAETARLHRYSMTSKENVQRGWSDSPLADLSPLEREKEKKAEREFKKRQAAAEKEVRTEALGAAAPETEAGGEAAPMPRPYAILDETGKPVSHPIGPVTEVEKEPEAMGPEPAPAPEAIPADENPAPADEDPALPVPMR